LTRSIDSEEYCDDSISEFLYRDPKQWELITAKTERSSN
jgi:hypothetical protein